MSLNAAAATNLLARTHWRILANRLWDNLRHDRVKTLTISAFLVIYGIAAYALVAAGLNFVHRLPLLDGMFETFNCSHPLRRDPTH